MLKPKPASDFSKFIAVLVSSSICISLIVFIYFMLKEREADKYRRILQNPYPMEAIVTEKRNYKGKGIDVEYTVNDQIYEYKTLIDNHTYQQYQVGDTISVTICQDDPSLALLTMEINRQKLERFLGEDANKYLNIWQNRSPK